MFLPHLQALQINIFYKKIRDISIKPVTMDAKLSSNNMISAASLATSEPEIPIANPTSAFLRAGASILLILILN